VKKKKLNNTHLKLTGKDTNRRGGKEVSRRSNPAKMGGSRNKPASNCEELAKKKAKQTLRKEKILAGRERASTKQRNEKKRLGLSKKMTVCAKKSRKAHTREKGYHTTLKKARYKENKTTNS